MTHEPQDGFKFWMLFWNPYKKNYNPILSFYNLMHVEENYSWLYSVRTYLKIWKGWDLFCKIDYLLNPNLVLPTSNFDLVFQ